MPAPKPQDSHSPGLQESWKQSPPQSLSQLQSSYKTDWSPSKLTLVVERASKSPRDKIYGLIVSPHLLPV